MKNGLNTYEMGLLPVDRFARSERNNYNLTFKLISLRKPRNYPPNNLSRIKMLILNKMLSRRSSVVSKGLRLFAASPFNKLYVPQQRKN